MENSEARPRDFAIAMGPRQITAMLLVSLTVAGILCCLSYIIGRTAARAAAAGPAPTHQNGQPGKAGAPCPALVIPASPVSTGASEWANSLPQPGIEYLQLMSVEPGIADVTAKGLHDEGFVALVAPGASPAVRRVLIGAGPNQTLKDVRSRLEALGIHYFPKTWSQPSEPATSAAPATHSEAPASDQPASPDARESSTPPAK